MAKTAYECKVGDYVYRPFEILKPGIVIKIQPTTKPHLISANLQNNREYDDVDVKFLDGHVETFVRMQLNDFRYAMEEHKKKWLKFQALCDELANL